MMMMMVGVVVVAMMILNLDDYRNEVEVDNDRDLGLNCAS